MPSSNSCFLTCIQISQEAGKVVWYYHLFKKFSEFVVIHTVKGFGVVNKAEVEVFLELFCFLIIQRFWSLVPLPFLKSAWISGSSQFMYRWNLAWIILSITLLTCEMSVIVQRFDHFLALPFFGNGMKTEIFQSCGHCWVFQMCWHIEFSTFTESSFRIWKSSAGIPSPPLALLIVKLVKTCLTSLSRMSGSGWVIAPLWLFRSWSFFVQLFWIFLPLLLNILYFC